MLVDLVDRLVDRLIQLLTYRTQQRKDLLDNCVTPIYEEFEKVHYQYLKSFENYRKLLSTTDEPLTRNSSIIDAIRKDNLFTQGQREKLSAFTRVTDDERLESFIAEIFIYLWFQTADPGSAGLYQVHRTNLIEFLEIISEDRWVEVAAQILSEYKEKEPRIIKYIEKNLSVVAPSMPDWTTLWDQDEELAWKLWISALCYTYNIDSADSNGIGLLKARLAIDALDVVVKRMQAQYSSVTKKYLSLRFDLSH